MRHHNHPADSALAAAIVAAILLAPQAALAVDIRFVLHGVMGVFRDPEAGQTTPFLPP